MKSDILYHHLMEMQKDANNNTLVSILMLTYNRARYIGEAIDSVLAQSYQNWQLIIIDSASNDNTPELVAQYTDPRILYHRLEENVGLSKARAKSLELVNGSYIAVLDSDDVWSDTEKLNKQVAFLEANSEYMLIGSSIRIIDETGQVVGQNSFAKSDSSIRSRLLSRNQFAHSAVLMRTSAVAKTTGYHNYPLAEDYNLFLQLGQLGKLANLPEYTTNYRVHRGNISAKKVELVKAIISIITDYKNTYPNYYLARLKHQLHLILRWTLALLNYR